LNTSAPFQGGGGDGGDSGGRFDTRGPYRNELARERGTARRNGREYNNNNNNNNKPRERDVQRFLSKNESFLAHAEKRIPFFFCKTHNKILYAC